MSQLALDAELVEFLESGVAILVGSCDRAATPCCLHGVGLRASAQSSEVQVYLLRALADRMLENFRDNPQIAVTFSRAADHRSLQLKGTVLSIDDTPEEERTVHERYMACYGASLLALGLPPQIAGGIAYWPSVRISFRVNALFEQTPGPHAGSPLPASHA
ncbi:MAG: hypothetical protein ACOY0T_16525 [Myxococcota bacterium]